MKRKAYLFSEAQDFEDMRGGRKLTSREKSMAKSTDTHDLKLGKLRKSSRKQYLQED